MKRTEHLVRWLFVILAFCVGCNVSQTGENPLPYIGWFVGSLLWELARLIDPRPK